MFACICFLTRSFYSNLCVLCLSVTHKWYDWSFWQGPKWCDCWSYYFNQNGWLLRKRVLWLRYLKWKWASPKVLCWAHYSLFPSMIMDRIFQSQLFISMPLSLSYTQPPLLLRTSSIYHLHLMEDKKNFVIWSLLKNWINTDLINLKLTIGVSVHVNGFLSLC